MTASEIGATFKESLTRPFPYKDCYWLCDKTEIKSEDFIPELDWYLATVTGYGSSATNLSNRSDEELIKARSLLSKKFFEYFPKLRAVEELINQQNTPDLSNRLESTERVRLALLNLLKPPHRSP